MRCSLAVLLIAQQATAFLAPRQQLAPTRSLHLTAQSRNEQVVDAELNEQVGAYTVAHRLDEEFKTPFRILRIAFGGFGTVTSLIVALVSTGQALAGSFADTPSLNNDALSGVGANVVVAGVCAAIAWNDYQASEANWKRITKDLAFANLRVMTALALAGLPAELQTTRLGDYRRDARLLICAGGADYIANLAVELGDIGGRTGATPRGMRAAVVKAVGLIVVPVLLDSPEAVADARPVWREVAPPGDGADAVVAFPQGSGAWAEYLADEIATARSQNIDPVTKGFTITINKNGLVLKRSTGLPSWDAIISGLEVLDRVRNGGRCCDGRCTGVCRIRD